jgi:hypothetical protein
MRRALRREIASEMAGTDQQAGILDAAYITAADETPDRRSLIRDGIDMGAGGDRHKVWCRRAPRGSPFRSLLEHDRAARTVQSGSITRQTTSEGASWPAAHARSTGKALKESDRVLSKFKG